MRAALDITHIIRALVLYNPNSLSRRTPQVWPARHRPMTPLLDAHRSCGAKFPWFLIFFSDFCLDAQLSRLRITAWCYLLGRSLRPLPALDLPRAEIKRNGAVSQEPADRKADRSRTADHGPIVMLQRASPGLKSGRSTRKPPLTASAAWFCPQLSRSWASTAKQRKW